MVEKNSPLKTKERVDHRLRKNKHFGYIYKKGSRKSAAHLTLFTVASKFKNYKIGFSINKKIGNAVARNRLKRRLKEIVRLQKCPKDYNNYVLLAREGAAELDFAALEKEVLKVFS